MWDLIVSVPDHCLSFYFTLLFSFSSKVRFWPETAPPCIFAFGAVRLHWQIYVYKSTFLSHVELNISLALVIRPTL